MNLIFDSSILIDNLRGGKVFASIIQNQSKPVQLILPTVVVMELFAGTSTRDSEKMDKAKKLISRFNKVSLSEKIAQRAGELYRDSKEKTDFPDYVIAATALEIGGVVVTLNKKHFDRIPNLITYPLV